MTIETKKQGFISGTLIVLILVTASISLSLLSMLKYATGRSLYDLDNIKAELIFEDVILSQKVNGINKVNGNLNLPQDFRVTSNEIVNLGIVGEEFTLIYKKDIKNRLWIRKGE